MRFHPLVAAIVGMVGIAALPALVKNADGGGDTSGKPQQPYKIAHEPRARSSISNPPNNEPPADLSQQQQPSETENETQGSSSVITNWIQAVSAAAIVLFTYLLWRLQGQQVGLMGGSLKVTQDALEHQHNISRLELRPWIAVDGVEIGRFEQGFLDGQHIPYGVTAKLRFKNVGAIPAVQVTAWTHHAITPVGATVPHFDHGPIQDGNSSVGPGKLIWGQTSMVADTAQSDALLAGQTNIWLYGYFRYARPGEPDITFETEVCERVLINGIQQTPTGPQLNIESRPDGPQNNMT